MISIHARRREDGVEITAEGHAGYAARGSDIVCAAVSALLYGFLAYLHGLAHEHGAGQVSREEREGYLWIRSSGLDGRDRMALDVTEAGLRMIADAYPAWVKLVSTPNAVVKGDMYDG